MPLPAADYAVLQATTGQSVIVVSAHLCWGGDKEGGRLAQMTAIDGRVRALVESYRDRHPVALLAGDFNTQPGSDTHRFLTGQGAGANGGYTYWTDAFAAAGDPAESVTVTGRNLSTPGQQDPTLAFSPPSWGVQRVSRM